MNGAELLIKCLQAEKVEMMWGYPGGAIMPVYDALLGSTIRHFLVRHEQAAAFAASGYARTTGRVGVCLATSGPGATNLLTGIADAYMDSISLVVITGQVATDLIGTDAFQEVDIIGITLPVVKHSFQVDTVDDIPHVVREAFRLAQEGRPGPIVIDFPKDVAATITSAEPIQPETEPTPDFTPESQWVEKAKTLLKNSRRPVIYAGGGVSHADATYELRRFVETTGIPVVHTLHGLGGLPGDHELFLGMLGMHGSKAANFAVQNSDLLIGIGVRFDDRATGKLAEFAPEASVIHMDIDAAEIGKLRTAMIPLHGEIKSSMHALSFHLEIEDWKSHCLEMKKKHACKYSELQKEIDAPKFLHKLSQAANENTFITCDVGQHQMWVAQHFQFSHCRNHVTSGGLGTMGFGLPTAIGVQCAYPDSTVINVTGDGSIMMNLQELATIKRYRLPIKILLFDNSALGLVRQWQELFFDGRESEVDLYDNPDFSEVARSFGIDAIDVKHDSETDDAIERLLNQPGSLLVHSHIDRFANVWPLVPPGKNNSHMIQHVPSSKGSHPDHSEKKISAGQNS